MDVKKKQKNGLKTKVVNIFANALEWRLLLPVMYFFGWTKNIWGH